MKHDWTITVGKLIPGLIIIGAGVLLDRAGIKVDVGGVSARDILVLAGVGALTQVLGSQSARAMRAKKTQKKGE